VLNEFSLWDVNTEWKDLYVDTVWMDWYLVYNLADMEGFVPWYRLGSVAKLGTVSICTVAKTVWP
jgi:mRNA-degrading endonuclease YafQ of YafQ-DinJ toxin-antitoxin module